MTEAGTPAQEPAPETGDPAVDAAVSGLDELDESPLADHHERLRTAHERLHAELTRDPHPGDG